MKNNLINNKKNFLGLISVILFFICWEIIGGLKIINPVFLSRPTDIFREGLYLVKGGALFSHVFASLEILLASVVLAIVAGVFLGLVLGSYKYLYYISKPFIYGLNALPKVAVIPLIIIWFGLSASSKIFIVFLMALMPILISTIEGVKKTDKSLIQMGRSFGASRGFVLKSISFFAALPFIFSGIRISIGRALVGLVVAEAFGYAKGLGFLVNYFGSSLQTARLLFVVLILLFLSILLNKSISELEKLIVKW